ncbi:MAG: OmpA family protein [Bacteroidales bacterium]|nr:OmpA family protein [Bacteroidales bacterium]
MKRILSVIAGVALFASVAGAQTADFKGNWFLQLQGGAGYTVGETDFSDLISPAGAIAVGYQFTPVFGMRLDCSGLQGKGAINNKLYKYNYAEPALDFMFDLASLFGGYKWDRTLNPYLFVGGGMNYAFNNDEANALSANFPKDNLLWQDSKILGALRGGLGLNIRLGNVVSLNLEGNSSFIGQAFNSKSSDDMVDFQPQALAGLTFAFGKAKPAPAPVVVPAPAPAPAPEPEPVVEQPVVEPQFESLTRNVLFIINTWDIRECEQIKIDEVVEALKANPDTKVRVSGYADKATGTAKRNMFLSQKRSEVVAQAIVDAGIDQDRIITEYFGDTVNPFDTPEANRVAVCLVK